MLSDRDLHTLAIEEELITPYNPEYCEGATINLTLDTVVKRYSSNEPIILGKEVTEDHYEKFDISVDEFWLEPKESVLIQTHEFLKVPHNMTARIYERYGVKSLGLMISPAHYMNPGYRGQISLIAVNNTPVRFRLIPGIKICQLALFELKTEPLKPYEKQDARYMDTTEVSISKLHLDDEIQDFLKEKGVKKVSEEMASDLGKHLMSHIKLAAKELADIARKEFKKGKKDK